jgi:UDP-N-acetylbacillosamine N-acetyltransferase
MAGADPSANSVVIAVGQPRIRQQIAKRFSQAGFAFPTLIHPTALVGAQVTLGEGCIVMAHSILETHLQLGSHVMVNLAAVVAHEGCIGSFSNIGPRSCLAGGVTIGERCDLGAGVTIRPRISLGDDLVLGAGSVVVKSVAGAGVFAGNPARELKRESHR